MQSNVVIFAYLHKTYGMTTIPFYRQFLQAAIFRFNESTPRIEKCLKALSEEQLWQRPNNRSNSVGNLVLHLCGNIRQYILSSLGGAEDLRVRDEEFATEGGWGRGALLFLLQSTAEEAVRIMEDCSEIELLRNRSVQGFELNGIGIVMHVVEHYSYHTGQIAFWTKCLLNTDLDFYGGVDLNIKNG